VAGNAAALIGLPALGAAAGALFLTCAVFRRRLDPASAAGRLQESRG
jgi:hypothetical protein